MKYQLKFCPVISNEAITGFIHSHFFIYKIIKNMYKPLTTEINFKYTYFLFQHNIHSYIQVCILIKCAVLIWHWDQYYTLFTKIFLNVKIIIKERDCYNTYNICRFWILFTIVLGWNNESVIMLCFLRHIPK